MGPPDLFDDGICVFNVILKLAWVDLEYLRLLINEVMVVLDDLRSFRIQYAKLLHQLLSWSFAHLDFDCSKDLLLQVLPLLLVDILIENLL